MIHIYKSESISHKVQDSESTPRWHLTCLRWGAHFSSCTCALWFWSLLQGSCAAPFLCWHSGLIMCQQFITSLSLIFLSDPRLASDCSPSLPHVISQKSPLFLPRVAFFPFFLVSQLVRQTDLEWVSCRRTAALLPVGEFTQWAPDLEKTQLCFCVCCCLYCGGQPLYIMWRLCSFTHHFQSDNNPSH